MAQVDMDWRKSKLHYLEAVYLEYYKKYLETRDENGYWSDDRGLYCNLYRNMEEAIRSLPERPILYVCVAMNEAIDADCKILRNIIRRFEYEFKDKKVPDWLIEEE